MPDLPVLRVVPLELIRRHEEIDPFRVEQLVSRINMDNIQVNPMVCAQAEDGTYVLLDGATRTEALKGMGLEHAVVQIVDPERVTLETWHHVVLNSPTRLILEDIEARPELQLTDHVGEPPRIHLVDGGYSSVRGVGVSPNAAISALVHTYIGKWSVSRVVDPTLDSVAWGFPDWSVVVEFPTLSIEDVISAAVSEDLLPAGVTRFLVDDRALRLNVDLGLLRSDSAIEDKQRSLEELLEKRAHEGRIRRYEETVFILDD